MNILSLAYLGNVQYFSKILSGDYVIDIHEHYVKQSYRNRCEIMTSNGVKSLVVQTVRGSNDDKSSVFETELDYSKRWQDQHWRSIVSSYRGSPYFDYYADLLEPHYGVRYDTLGELNMRMMETVCILLGVDGGLNYSKEYVQVSAADEDWRGGISPKPRLRVEDGSFRAMKYWQVFGDRYPFAANLSILDLLFCEGVNARKVIEGSILLR